MAKSKKQKILASILAATTMASFYASPVFSATVSENGYASIQVLQADDESGSPAANKPVIKFRLKEGEDDVKTAGTMYYDEAGATYKMDFNGAITADSLVSNGGITAKSGTFSSKLTINDADGNEIVSIKNNGNARFGNKTGNYVLINSGIISSNDGTSEAKSTLSSSRLQLYDAEGNSAVNITNGGVARFGKNNELNVRIEDGELSIMAANDNASGSSNTKLATLSQDGLMLNSTESGEQTLTAKQIGLLNAAVTQNGNSVVLNGNHLKVGTTPEDPQGRYPFEVDFSGAVRAADGAFGIDAKGNVTGGTYNGVSIQAAEEGVAGVRVGGIDLTAMRSDVDANASAIGANTDNITALQTNTAGITRTGEGDPGTQTTTIEVNTDISKDGITVKSNDADPVFTKMKGDGFYIKGTDVNGDNVASLTKDQLTLNSGATYLSANAVKVTEGTHLTPYELSVNANTKLRTGMLTLDEANDTRLSNNALDMSGQRILTVYGNTVAAYLDEATFGDPNSETNSDNVRIKSDGIYVKKDSGTNFYATLTDEGLALYDTNGTTSELLTYKQLATINSVIDDNGAVVSKGDVTSTDGTTTYSLNTIGSNLTSAATDIEALKTATTGIIYTEVDDVGVTSIGDNFSVNQTTGDITAGKLNGVQFSVYDNAAVTSRAISEDQNGDIIAATDGAEAQRLNLSAMDRDINDIYDRTEGITERREHNGYSTTQIEGSVEINNNNGLSVLGDDGKTAAATIDRSGAATFNSVKVNNNITAGGNVTADGIGRFGDRTGPNVRMEKGVLTINSSAENAVASLSKDGLMLTEQDENGTVTLSQTLTATKIYDIANITRTEADGVSTTTIEDTLKVSSDGIVKVGDNFSVDTTGAMNGVSSINGAAVSGIDSDSNGTYGLEISGVTLEEGLVDGVDVSALKTSFDTTSANTAGITRTGEGVPGNGTTTIETATSFTADGMTTKTISAGNGKFAVNNNGYASVYGENGEDGVYTRMFDRGLVIKDGDEYLAQFDANGLRYNGEKVISVSSTDNSIHITADSYTAGEGDNTVRIVSGDEHKGVYIRDNGTVTSYLSKNELMLRDSTNAQQMLTGDKIADIQGVTRTSATNAEGTTTYTTTIEGVTMQNGVVTGSYLKTVYTDEEGNVQTGFLADNKGNVKAADVTVEQLKSTGDVVTGTTDAEGNFVQKYSLNEIGDNTQHIEHFAADATAGTVDRTVIEGATTFTEEGMSVEGKYGSFNVQNVTNGTNGNTMIFVEDKQGNDVLYIDTQTGNLVTKGAISAGDGAFLANETGISVGDRFLVDAAKGNVAIKNGTNADDVYVFQVNGETGQVNVGANGGPQTVITGNSVTTETLNVETIVLGNKIVDAATGEETTTGKQIQIGANGAIDIYDGDGGETGATPVFHADYDDFGLKYGDYSMAMNANGFVLGRAGKSSLTLDATKGFEFSGPVNLGAGKEVGFTYDNGTETGQYITLDSLVDKVNDIYDRTSGIYKDGDGNTVVTNEVGTWNDTTKKTEYTGNGSEITVGANGATFENGAGAGTTNINGSQITSDANGGSGTGTGGGGAAGTTDTSVTDGNDAIYTGDEGYTHVSDLGVTVSDTAGNQQTNIDKDGVLVTDKITGDYSYLSDQGLTINDGADKSQTNIDGDGITTGQGTFSDSVTVGGADDGKYTQLGESGMTVFGDNETTNNISSLGMTVTTGTGADAATNNISSEGMTVSGSDGTNNISDSGMTVTGTDGTANNISSAGVTMTDAAGASNNLSTAGMTVSDAAGDNTTNITNNDVEIKSDDYNIKLSDMGEVADLDSEIAADRDGDGRTTVVEAVNNEADIRRSEIARLDNRIDRLEDRIDKVGAMSAAIANLRTMGYDPAAPTEIAVGVGQYRSETGAALGLFHYPNRDFMLSLSVSTSGDEVMGGIGATWKFGRKSPEKAAELRKTQEAADRKQMEANKIAKAEQIKRDAMAQKVAAQRERHAKLAEEIGE